MTHHRSFKDLDHDEVPEGYVRHVRERAKDHFFPGSPYPGPYDPLPSDSEPAEISISFPSATGQTLGEMMEGSGFPTSRDRIRENGPQGIMQEPDAMTTAWAEHQAIQSRLHQKEIGGLPEHWLEEEMDDREWDADFGWLTEECHTGLGDPECKVPLPAPPHDTPANPFAFPLPTDKEERKNSPVAKGVLDYFKNALFEVAKVSKAGNDQHNPGQPLHWSRDKSTDHADCIMRHLSERGDVDDDGMRHSAKLAWRALALLQSELEDEYYRNLNKEIGA